MKADLHIHSNWSDGSLSVGEIIKTARALKLRAVSITDHDTMDGQEEALEEGARQGLRVIPGIEVSALDPDSGRKVHILGYQARDRDSVSRACRPYLEDRGRAVLEAVDAIRAAGYPLDREDVAACAGKLGIPYRQHVMRALADRGYTRTIYGPLYDKLFGPGGPGAVKSRYMSACEAVRLIRECGGEAVLAHPFQYDSMGLLPKLVEWGLTGIEHRHHTQTPDREKIVREQAERYGLFLTGGSDFHGLYMEKSLPLGAVTVELSLTPFLK
ncbi:MAG: PHP domain-containing protein [Treponema sp.]|jgi:predicted metal-dependent phosphoesterase TrpH|nr:PHP domain-containing protein [Treponema sp.]